MKAEAKFQQVIEFEKADYLLSFTILSDDSFSIILESKGKNSSIAYEVQTSLSDLIESNGMFKIFSNMETLIETLVEKAKRKELNFELWEENNLKMTFKEKILNRYSEFSIFLERKTVKEIEQKNQQHEVSKLFKLIEDKDEKINQLTLAYKECKVELQKLKEKNELIHHTHKSIISQLQDNFNYELSEIKKSLSEYEKNSTKMHRSHSAGDSLDVESKYIEDLKKSFSTKEETNQLFSKLQEENYVLSNQLGEMLFKISENQLRIKVLEDKLLVTEQEKKNLNTELLKKESEKPVKKVKYEEILNPVSGENEKSNALGDLKQTDVFDLVNSLNSLNSLLGIGNQEEGKKLLSKPNINTLEFKKDISWEPCDSKSEYSRNTDDHCCINICGNSCNNFIFLDFYFIGEDYKIDFLFDLKPLSNYRYVGVMDSEYDYRDKCCCTVEKTKNLALASSIGYYYHPDHFNSLFNVTKWDITQKVTLYLYLSNGKSNVVFELNSRKTEPLTIEGNMFRVFVSYCRETEGSVTILDSHQIIS